MNWYRKHIFAQALQGYLQSLNVRPEVANFVTALPNEKAQFFVNTVRQNPQITLPQLQQSVTLPVEQKQPYLNEELNLVRNFSPAVQKWLLVNLRKTRKGRTDIPFKELTLLGIKATNEAPGYYHLLDLIRLWTQQHSLRDFLDIHPNINIDSYTPDQMHEMIYEWHELLSQGSSDTYDQTDPALIVYSNWQEEINRNKQGWTIQEITSENDLKVEGEKMDHCVGGFYQRIQNGKVRIFSLRDPSNEPHVTIETDSGIQEFEQLQGQSNSDPKDEYKAMIKEWVLSLGHDCYDRDGPYNVIQDVPYFETIKDINDKMDQIISSKKQNNEYGFNTYQFLDVDDLDTLIDYAIQENKNARNGNYFGDIRDSGLAFVDAFIKLHGIEKLPELKKEMEDIRQTADEKLYDYWSSSDYDMSTFPKEEDYETDEEFAKAEEEWREKEQEYQDEEMQSYMNDNLPWAVLDDMRDRIKDFREKEKTNELV